MNDLIDQFGRDKSKPINDDTSDDKSKKIFESLAEIKNQLENKKFIPKEEEHYNIRNKDIKNVRTKNLDFDELRQRIEFLEEKLITLDNKVPSDNYKTKLEIEKNIELEKSIFHSYRNDNELVKGKSLLVLGDQKNYQISKFKFFHFILVTFAMILTIMLLTSYEKKIGFLEIINIFFSEFN